MTCCRRLRAWTDAGVWGELHRRLLEKFHRADKIDWTRACVDASLAPAKRGGDEIGPNPSAGEAKLMNQSNFRSVAVAFPSRRFLSASSVATAEKVFAPSSAFAALAAFLTARGSSPRASTFRAASRASRTSFRPTAG
jgi:hypothetical protein